MKLRGVLLIASLVCAAGFGYRGTCAAAVKQMIQLRNVSAVWYLG